MPVGIELPRLPDSVLAHCRLKHPPKMGPLYHFYSYEGLHTFRITSYASYCEAAQQGGYPICVELWHLEGNEEAVRKTVLAELEVLGIAAPGEVSFIGTARTPNLHLGTTLKSVAAMRELRGAISQRGLKNLSLLGVFGEEGQMLLYEVWRSMYRTISEAA